MMENHALVLLYSLPPRGDKEVEEYFPIYSSLLKKSCAVQYQGRCRSGYGEYTGGRALCHCKINGIAYKSYKLALHDFFLD